MKHEPYAALVAPERLGHRLTISLPPGAWITLHVTYCTLSNLPANTSFGVSKLLFRFFMYEFSSAANGILAHVSRPVSAEPSK